MKKKILLALTVVCLILLCSVCASAAETHPSHPICGLTCTCEGVTHPNLVWYAWDGKSSIGSSNYYLTSDVTRNNDYTIKGTVNICLNDHKISEDNLYYSGLWVSTTGTLGVTDCGTAGEIHADSYGILNYGRFKLYNAKISGEVALLNYLGAVANVYSGTLSGENSAVDNYDGATLNAYGGTAESDFIAIDNMDATANISDMKIYGPILNYGTMSLKNCTSYLSDPTWSVTAVENYGTLTAQAYKTTYLSNTKGTPVLNGGTAYLKDVDITASGTKFSIHSYDSDSVCYLYGYSKISALRAEYPNAFVFESKDGSEKLQNYNTKVQVYVNHENFSGEGIVISKIPELSSLSFEQVDEYRNKASEFGYLNYASGALTFSKHRFTGTCGENLKWALTYDYTLVISGSGDMTDYYSTDIPWASYKNSIKKVVVESGVTSLCERAFDGCDSLTEVVLGDTLVSIGLEAFDDSTKIKSITLPDSLVEIGDWAFEDCYDLEKVYIGAGLKTIGRRAFRYNRTTEYVVSAQNPYYKAIDGNLYSKDGKTLIRYALGKTDASFTLPAGVTTIGFAAFEGETDLKSITIPLSVTKIENDAFWLLDESLVKHYLDAVYYEGNASLWRGIDISYENNYALTSATVYFGSMDLSDLIYELVDGEIVIVGCSKYVAKIEIPDYIGTYPVTKIESGAFDGCSGMTEITIGRYVKTINESAFDECAALAEVYYNCTADEWTSIAIGNDNDPLLNANVHFNYLASGTCGEDVRWALHVNGTMTVSGTGAMTDYSSYTSTPWYSYRSSIKKVVIENGVTTVGECSFYDYDNLTEVVMADSVEKIKRYAFAFCSYLSSVTLSEGLWYIGDSAFRYCEKLSTVTLPQSTSYIGNEAFQNTALKSIYIPSKVSTIGERAFFNFYISSVEVDENNTYFSSIDGVLFDKNKETLIFYPSQKRDKEYTVPESVKNINSCAFYFTDYLENIVLSDALVSIGNSAFCGSNELKGLRLGANVSSVDATAFGYCDRFTAFEVDENNPSFTALDGVLFSKDMSVLVAYPCGNKMTAYTIPSVVTTIGEHAFYGNDCLATVFTKNVRRIESYAFYYAKNLKNVVCSEGLTFIGYNAFASCYYLESATLPSTVSYIDYYAFGFCSKLKAVNYYGTPEDFAKIDVLYGNDTLLNNLVFVKHIKTNVSDDSKLFTVTPVNFDDGITVVLALYNGDKFVEAHAAISSGESIPFATEEEYTCAKVMLFDSIVSIAPITDVQIVNLAE